MQTMHVHQIVPILNVSDLPASVEWFAKLGWNKSWDWCPPDSTRPTFGSVTAGDVEIFLCQDGQGGRGENGVWLAIWVRDVDEVHQTCLRELLEVVYGPKDESWGMREMHVRHPDGHIFRIGQPLHADDHDEDHEHPHGHSH
jgi:catechol 2,3-dioxygenase-like lactoylglutathione lyase family enzyme